MSSADGILIIGVDPASTANAFVSIALTGSEGRWSASLATVECQITPRELDARIKKWQHQNVLLIWDAPLTGPKNVPHFAPRNDAPLVWQNGDFSIRELEQELVKIVVQPVPANGYSTLNKGRKVVGISTRHYSGCSHWAITRALLGLPRVGRFDAPEKDLPFQPIFADMRLREMAGLGFHKACVVETHPAVALWSWLHDHPDMKGLGWEYKGARNRAAKDTQKRQRGKMLICLLSLWENTCPCVASGLKASIIAERLFEDDADCFDALVAAMLGLLYVTQKGQVRLYGSAAKGAMLLPQVPCLSRLNHQEN